MAMLLTPRVTTQLMGSSVRWPNTMHWRCPQALNTMHRRCLAQALPTRSPGPALVMVCVGQSVYGRCSVRACGATTKRTQATQRLVAPLCSRQARAIHIKMVATCAHVLVVPSHRRHHVCLCSGPYKFPDSFLSRPFSSRYEDP
jgi:hypothetical protein